MASLRDGSADARSAAAERLFNKAAMDESARLRTTSMGVVQPLVSLFSGLQLAFLLCIIALQAKSTQEMTRKVIFEKFLRIVKLYFSSLREVVLHAAWSHTPLTEAPNLPLQ